MYTLAAIATFASVAFAAPAPQGQTLCNPAAVPTGPFHVAAYNPASNNYTGLAIAEVSRGAKILVGTPDKSVAFGSEFTFQADTDSLCATGFGCDDGATNVPLLFGSPGPEVTNGDFYLQAGKGCFTDPKQTPLFLAAGADGSGDGTSADDDFDGWVFCQGITGIYWNGAEAAPEGCEKVGMQIFEL